MSRVSIVAAMHGDETYGIELFETFVDKYPSLKDKVQLVVGNELAYKMKTRFIDSDMNRHYNSKVNDHEYKEMKRVGRMLDDFRPDYVLDIHTTKRDSGIFFISDTLSEARERICAMLGIDVCVMKHEIVKTSFIGHYDNSVSLEYSLNSITENTTKQFIEALASLIKGDYPLKASRHAYMSFVIIYLKQKLHQSIYG